MKKQVRYKGVKYDSLKELTEAFYINYDTFMMRVHRGASIKQAIEFKHKYAVTHRGFCYSSRKDLVECLVPWVDNDQFNYRYRKCGGSITKAIKLCGDLRG